MRFLSIFHASIMFVVGLACSTAANAQCGPSGSVGISSATGLLTTLNTVNTAFLTQANAFVTNEPDATSQPAGGVWGRTVGGAVNLNGNGVVTFVNPPAAPSPCRTRFDERYAGVQVGADLMKLITSGGEFHFGATAGFIGASGHEVGGPALGDFSVPFVGAYATFIQGGFFADVLVRYDAYSMDLSQPQVGLNSSTNGRAYSVSSSAGYNYSLGQWFVEPSAGFIWSTFNVDSIPFSGNVAFNVPVGNLQVNDIESLLGKASIRVGINQVSGNVVWQPYVSATVWHEFADNSVLSAVTGGTPIFSLSSDRVGTYGQYALGLAASSPNSAWVGYARVDYRKGDSIEAWGVNAGFRYNFGFGIAPKLITKG